MVPIMRDAVEYLDAAGRSPFGRWFDTLDARAAAKVTIAVSRVEQGNISSIKTVGEGVSEIRIDWGPGYRIYIGFDGQVLILLLAGGTKRRQDNDIANAKTHWTDYKKRKKKE